MGFFSSIGNAVKGVGHTLGSIASNPLVDGALGLVGGPGIAAAVGGLGHLFAPGGNLGSALHGAVTGGAAGTGAGALKDGVTGILSGGLNGLGGNASNVLKGATTLGATTGTPAGATADPGLLQRLGGTLGGIAGSSVGGVPLPIAGLAGLQGANAAQLGAKSNDFADKAWDYASKDYDARAPLRTMGIAGLTNPTPRDTSGLTAIRSRITPGLAGVPGQPTAPRNGGPLRVS